MKKEGENLPPSHGLQLGPCRVIEIFAEAGCRMRPPPGQYDGPAIGMTEKKEPAMKESASLTPAEAGVHLQPPGRGSREDGFRPATPAKAGLKEKAEKSP